MKNPVQKDWDNILLYINDKFCSLLSYLTTFYTHNASRNIYEYTRK